MTLVRTTGEGTVTIPDDVLEAIVARAAEHVDGVRVRRRRVVDVDARAVRLEIAARRGEPLPALGERVQASVADALRTMCAFDPRTVDVAVEDLW
jgi:uncharacterized alkaline shock family protein YloU